MLFGYLLAHKTWLAQAAWLSVLLRKFNSIALVKGPVKGSDRERKRREKSSACGWIQTRNHFIKRQASVLLLCYNHCPLK